MKSIQATLLLIAVFVAAGNELLAQDTPAETSAGTGSRVIDNAGLFKPSVVEDARKRLQEVEKTSGVSVVIETIESLRGATIDEAASQSTRSIPDAGVYILIAKAERRISDPVVRPEFAARISANSRKKIRDAMLRGFQGGNFDQGLNGGVATIVAVLDDKPAETGSASPLVSRDKIQLTLQGAKTIIRAAEAKATEMNLKMNIAVVDDGGHLIAFVRMDGGRPASAATATTKAISAATFRQATGPLPSPENPDLLLSLSVPAAAQAGGARITPLLGGVPIEVDGQIIGAVGVGGGTGKQDAEVAVAGISAFLEEIAAASRPAEGTRP